MMNFQIIYLFILDERNKYAANHLQKRYKRQNYLWNTSPLNNKWAEILLSVSSVNFVSLLFTSPLSKDVHPFHLVWTS